MIEVKKPEREKSVDAVAGALSLGTLAIVGIDVRDDCRGPAGVT